MENFDKIIEIGIENTSIPYSNIPVVSGSKYEEFELNDHGDSCSCPECSKKVTLVYSGTGIGNLGGLLMHQLGPTEYNIDLNVLGSNHYNDDGKSISDYVIEISGDDAYKVTKNLAEKGWRKFSALEFGLVQTYDDEGLSIPSSLMDATKIHHTCPAVKIYIDKDEPKYVKLSDIIEHETRKLNDN